MSVSTCIECGKMHGDCQCHWTEKQKADFIKLRDEYMKMTSTPTERMQSRIAELEAENKRLFGAYAKTSNDVEQVLAQALGGYPWYKDDPQNFPDATEANGVCIADHTPGSLADEAARRIKELTAARARLATAFEKVIINRVDALLYRFYQKVNDQSV